jgi:hypothetical protein
MDALRKNIISQQEFAVLATLRNKTEDQTEQNTSEINEISANTGIDDNDEVLRALYTLEGKSFVKPEPPGSFTSNIWRITDAGVKALAVVEETLN